jgi:hypothetical protein
MTSHLLWPKHPLLTDVVVSLAGLFPKSKGSQLKKRGDLVASLSSPTREALRNRRCPDELPATSQVDASPARRLPRAGLPRTI